MTNGKHVTGLTLGIAAALSLASCGNALSGAGQPMSGSASTSATTGQAPKVAQPLNVGKYLQNPCSLLSSRQLQSIGFTSTAAPSAQGSDATGAQCGWNDDNASSHIGVSWQATFTNGLSDLYERKNRQKYFQPTQVEGYPAVVSSEFDDRAEGTCVVYAGPTDSNVFFVRYHGFNEPQKSQSCDLAQKAAGLVIDTMRNGGS